MKFAATNNDLRLLARISPEEIGWSEALAMMLNILDDIRTESHRELSSLSFDSDALKKWRALTNALLTVPMASTVSSLPDRSRERLQTLQDQLSRYSAQADGARQSLDAFEKEEKELLEKLKEHEATAEKLREQQREVEALRQEVETLEGEIRAVGAVDTQEWKQKREQLEFDKEKKIRLSEEYEHCTMQADILAKELDALTQGIGEMQKKITDIIREKREVQVQSQLKQDELANLEQVYAALTDDISTLDGRIEEQRSAITSCNDEIVNKNVELQEKKRLLDTARAGLENAEERVQTAAEEKAEIERETELLKKELDDLAGQIAELKTNSPDLKRNIEEQKAALEEERNKQDAEIQALSQEQEELNRQINDAKAKLDAMIAQKSASEELLEKDRKQAEDSRAAITTLEEDIRRCQEERLELNSQKQGLMNQKNRFIADIREYQRFFDSEECQRTRDEIEHYRLIINEYQNAVNELFLKKTSVYAEQLTDLRGEYRQIKDNLRWELMNLQENFNRLSTHYLDVVQRLEERIKL